MNKPAQERSKTKNKATEDMTTNTTNNLAGERTQIIENLQNGATHFHFECDDQRIAIRYFGKPDSAYEVRWERFDPTRMWFVGFRSEMMASFDAAKKIAAQHEELINAGKEY